MIFVCVECKEILSRDGPEDNPIYTLCDPCKGESHEEASQEDLPQTEEN